MTREDKRIFVNLGLCVSLSLCVLYLIGVIVLWQNPATDLDRKCLGKSMTELNRCYSEFYGNP